MNGRKVCRKYETFEFTLTYGFMVKPKTSDIWMNYMYELYTNFICKRTPCVQ